MARGAINLWQGVPARRAAAAADLDLDLGDLSSLAGGEPGRAPLTGIKALMLAVLDNGIAAYLSSVATLHTEAEAWVNSRSQRSPFAFPVVCETLGLEPGAVRVALHRWRESEAPRRQAGRRRPNVSRAGRVVARKPR